MKKTLIILASVLLAAFATAYTLKPKHRLAPLGTFFVLQSVSLTMHYGVTGLPPGLRVQLVEDKGDKMLIQGNDAKVGVNTDILTNDTDLGELAGKTDPVSRQEFATSLQKRRAEAMAAQEKGDVEQEKDAGAASRGAGGGKSATAHRPFIYDLNSNYWWRR